MRDTYLFLNKDDAIVIENPKKEQTRKALIALEYGAKINVKKSATTIGGGAANSAVTFSRLGFSCAAMVSVGRDSDGKAIVEMLADEKISPQLVQTQKNLSTGMSTLLVTEGKHRDHIAILERGANEKLEFFKADAKWIYLTSISGDNCVKVIGKIAGFAQKKGIKWAWNPGSVQLKAGLKGLKKYLPYCTVLLLNRDEALGLVSEGGKRRVKDDIPDLLRTLLKSGARSAVITEGPKGAYYADKGKMLFMAADKSVKLTESTGAGDGFGSGFVSGLMLTNMQDIAFALDLGIANSESIIQEIGAQKGALRKRDIKKATAQGNHKLYEK